MEFYIIRHAQSANNALLNQRQRVQDPSLTELGHRQAEVVAQHLATGLDPEQKRDALEGVTAVHGRRGYGLTRLYCSAMHRSLQTAWPIAKATGLVPEVWLDIHESGGIFLDHFEEGGIKGYPGKTRSEILAEFPDCTLPEALTEEGWWRGSQETHWECSGRAMMVAEKLTAWAGNGERVGIVTHGAFIDTLIKALTNQLPGSNLYYHHYNTAITRIDFRREGFLDIRYINRFDHLPPELVT